MDDNGNKVETFRTEFTVNSNVFERTENRGNDSGTGYTSLKEDSEPP